MTAQFPETLEYKDKRYVMCTEPLSAYFSMGGRNPGFVSLCTACWRGYVGSWKIEASRLYLIGISGELGNGQEVTLRDLFPGYVDRVFAHWYTGTLRCPQGEMVNYVHMGYASEYQADLMIHIRRGVVIGSELVRHTEDFNEDSDDFQYGMAGFATFGRPGDDKT